MRETITEDTAVCMFECKLNERFEHPADVLRDYAPETYKLLLSEFLYNMADKYIIKGWNDYDE